jgi:lipopolysaccharide biosynthesis regulator YciM
MNTLLLAITAVALVALVALMLRPVQQDTKEKPGEDERISPLLRGINYLLSDKPDLALQEMVQVARLRSEAADVYMALGEMFRSKGEIGRAVRIHQNLLARPDLPKAMHLQARVALAIDFQTGGLLDRALYQYQKALDMQPDHAAALEASLRIREQSSEWLLAEDLLSRLERVRDESYSSYRAYLFSEVAGQHCQQAEVQDAHRYALKALDLDASCAPARMVEIELAFRNQDEDKVESDIRLLWQNSREHFPLLIPLLLQYESFYEQRGRSLLLEFWQESRNVELLLAWLETLASVRGIDEAQLLCQELNYTPDSLRSSLRLTAILGDDDGVHTRFAREWREKAKNFACEQCGVEVVEMRWQCPQCHIWGSLHPKSDESI